MRDRIRYYIQKMMGCVLDKPVFSQKSVIAYSLVKSERYNLKCADESRVYPPFFAHNVNVDSYSYVAKNSNMSNLSIGKFCSIGPNFCCGLGLHPTNGVSTSPMFYSLAKQNGTALCHEDKYQETKHTIIGNDVFIGANVTVIDGVKIGDGAVVGAGAVVVKDIPPYAVAVGVPAKVVKYRFSNEIVSELMEKKWWNDESALSKVEKYFWDIDAFIKSYNNRK